MDTKKKTVKKIKVEVIPTYTLTQEQYDTLFRLISWNNPLSHLDMISQMQDTTLLEIGYKVGIAYNEFYNMLDECETILRDIDPESNEMEDTLYDENDDN